MARMLLSLSLVLALGAALATPTVWPMPQSVLLNGETYPISRTFQIRAVGKNSDVLTSAAQRYAAIINAIPTTSAPDTTTTTAVGALEVNVQGDDLSLKLETDESYTLTVAAPTSQLQAATAYGALRGLETFAQLVARGSAGLVVTGVTVQDFPRFQHRGILVDSARHFLPVSVLTQFIDAMSYSKFNVLHWHIVDDESFPFVSRTFPALSGQGAFNNVTHVYSPADVQNIVEYARLRGVRVVPEFDTPGHSTCWGRGQPGLLTPCVDAQGVPTGKFGPIDPTKNSSFEFLHGLFSEVADVFPDKYVHIGGDEVLFGCWRTNPDVQRWMAQQGMTDVTQLEEYYETRLLDILGQIGKSYIVWQEIFDNGLKVKPDTVVEVWKKDGWQDTMSRVTQSGLRAILSSPWYLNYISYGKDWVQYYTVEPTNFTASAEQKKLVMGGEACFWGEYIDATNLISRAWPRTAAVGERLWSDATINDPTTATPRLHEFRCKLLSRGINAQPTSGPSYCEFEYPHQYTPPWASAASEKPTQRG